VDTKEYRENSQRVGGVVGKIGIVREPGTDYLFAGLLEKELDKQESPVDAVIGIEPRSGDISFCQDYSFDHVTPPQFVFYALPSWREEHTKIMGERCALVSYAADPELHKPKNLEKKFDVGFVGNRYYHERNKMIEAVESTFHTAVYSGLPGYEIADRLSECKVLLNHTRPEIDVNLRFFEEMALGCQVMLRTPSLSEFAVEGVHYMGYSSEEECVEVIKKLLKDDDLRQKITHNARSHFLANHTYAHRAKAIINHLTEYLGGL
jgi:spore maturation protein CgeB